MVSRNFNIAYLILVLLLNIILFFLSDWDKENITEPPPTKNISIEDLNKIASGEADLTEFIPKVMSHSIANERCVQATSKKVKIRRGYNRVHSALLQTQKSITYAPYTSTKRHFVKLSKASKPPH